jgi:hypothetical protein
VDIDAAAEDERCQEQAQHTKSHVRIIYLPSLCRQRRDGIGCAATKHAGRLPALANRLDYLRIDHRRRRAVQVGIAWDLIWIGAPEQLAVRQAPSRMKRASVDQGHCALSTDRNRERSRNNPSGDQLAPYPLQSTASKVSERNGTRG